MIEFELNWEDKSTIEDKFVIERLNGVVWIQVGEVEKDVETFVDYSAKLNTEYTYRVVAEAFGKRSDPSNEFTLKASGIQCTINPTADLTFSVTKTGAAPIWITPPDIHSTGLTVDVQSGQAGTLILIVDAKANVSTIDLGSTSGASGEIDLTGFSSLTNFTAKNGYIQLRLDAATIQRSNFTLDLENSIIDEARLITLIDRIILANGGTIDNDSTDYTGSAGLNYANRVLNVGTLTLDLTINTNKILYQKVKALEALGWTISTIKTYCEKILKIDTQGSYYAVTWLERTHKISYLNNVEGESLYLDLYDTEEHAADVENTTGRININQGIAGINDWLTEGLWPDGVKYYLRAYSSEESSANNKANLHYLAYPDEKRPCGAVIDITGLEQLASYSSRMILVDGYDGDFYEENVNGIITVIKDQKQNYDLTLSGDTSIYGGELQVDAFNINRIGRYSHFYPNVYTNPISYVVRFYVPSTAPDSVTINTSNGFVIAGVQADVNVGNINLRAGANGYNLFVNEGGGVITTLWLGTKLDQWVTIGVLIDEGNFLIFENGEEVNSGFNEYVFNKPVKQFLIGDNKNQNYKLSEFIIYNEIITEVVYQKIYEKLN